MDIPFLALQRIFCLTLRLRIRCRERLSYRKLWCVVINESVSGNREVESGVPQGSILGPLLFVLFINDMFSCVSSGTEIALYADDTKIWRKIESWDDHLALQEDINSLHSWSIQNKMKFHPLKCKVLRVTLNHIEDYKTIPLPHCIFHYQMNGGCILTL